MDIQEHPWVTEHGEELLISEEENCEKVVTEVTEEEIHNAIKSIASIFTVVNISRLQSTPIFFSHMNLRLKR